MKTTIIGILLLVLVLGASLSSQVGLNYACNQYVISTEKTEKCDSLQTVIDSLDDVIHFYEETIDSLPWGSPLDTIKVNSHFGWRWGRRHQGIDLDGRRGDTIYSTADGYLIFSGWISGYGQTIQIEHSNNQITLYGHLSKRLRDIGEVKKGEPIGLVGSTGNSLGNHLHYEIMFNKERVDPYYYINRDTIFNRY